MLGRTLETEQERPHVIRLERCGVKRKTRLECNIAKLREKDVCRSWQIYDQNKN